MMWGIAEVSEQILLNHKYMKEDKGPPGSEVNSEPLGTPSASSRTSSLFSMSLCFFSWHVASYSHPHPKTFRAGNRQDHPQLWLCLIWPMVRGLPP